MAVLEHGRTALVADCTVNASETLQRSTGIIHDWLALARGAALDTDLKGIGERAGRKADS
eukprot:2254331-Rhodomonas_salina.2